MHRQVQTAQGGEKTNKTPAIPNSYHGSKSTRQTQNT